MNEITIDRGAYLVRESEHLRAVYLQSAQETWTIERYAMTATALIWSWCAAHIGEPGFRLLVWAPFLITILLGMRTWSIYRNMVLASAYLAQLEGIFGLPEKLGWERHLRHRRDPLRIVTGYLFWPLITSVTFAVAVWMG